MFGKIKINGIAGITFLVFLFIWALAPMAQAGCDSNMEDFEEAIKQTEDEWNAVRQSMSQGADKLKEIKKKYEEYRDAINSKSPEEGIEWAKIIFKLNPDQTDAARNKLNQLRGKIAELDGAGFTDKLGGAIDKLGFAGDVAENVSNVWEFTKTFNPSAAKNNPTHGLRTIGKLITTGTTWIKKVPIVGESLGSLFEAYAGACTDYANALDRLSKKIADARGGSLCGQSGSQTDEQKAFEEASTGQACQSFLISGAMPRLHAKLYHAQSEYFVFDPRDCKGCIIAVGIGNKIYTWQGLLLNRKALFGDYMCLEARKYKPETERLGKEYFVMFKGWAEKSTDDWLIIQKLNLMDEVVKNAKYGEEKFVANYMLDKSYRSDIDKIVAEWKKYVLISGTVREETETGDELSQGAKVEFTTSGNTKSMTTGQYGQYEILMKAEVGASILEHVSKKGFTDIKSSGRIPRKVVHGLDYTLKKEGGQTCIITGHVYDTTSGSPVPAGGATVSGSGPGETSVGSTTTGGDGSYELSVTGEENTTVTITATKDNASGGNTAIISGEAVAGVDITLKAGKDEDDDEGAPWIINVTVNDDKGQPLANATVTCTGGVASVTTGADGKATVGPIDIPDTYPEEPFSVTLTATVKVQGGQDVSGSGATVNYKGTTPSAVTLSIPVVIPNDVTISGVVQDANGINVGGAVVAGKGLSITVGASGSFTIGPYQLIKDDQVTLTATLTEGTHTFSGNSVTSTFDGVNKKIAGVVLVLDIETEVDVVITGLVADLDGKPLESATVTGGGVSDVTDGGGRYTLPPFKHKLGTPVTITATIVDKNGVTVSGSVTTTPTTERANAATIVLDVKQEDVWEVTVSGTVVDEQGSGVGGAVVTAGTVSTSTSGDGSFSLPPVELGKNETVSVSATFTDGTEASAGGPVTRVFDGVNTDISGVTITLKTKSTATVTVSGMVKSSSGTALNGATVSGGGQFTTTDGAGNFSFTIPDCELNKSLPINASYTDADGNVYGGSGSISPTSESASLNITIDTEGVSDEDIDDLIDELLDDVDPDTDWTAKLGEFNLLASELDGIALDFYSEADFVEQRLRELGVESCKNKEVLYSIGRLAGLVGDYDALLFSASVLYGELLVGYALNPDNVELASADGIYGRLEAESASMKSKHSSVLGAFGAYKCDEDDAETETGDEAGEGGTETTLAKTEKCDNGIDDDLDGEIDECDAGCCERTVNITVTDCGNAKDDIFVVSLDGTTIGVTPEGMGNSWSRTLDAGSHSVGVTCIKDEYPPGTACVSIVVLGRTVEDQSIEGGDALGITLGATEYVTFEVPDNSGAAAYMKTLDPSAVPQEGGR